MPETGWFNEAKFGLFIHWGIYSLLERGEQVLFREHLTPSAYARLADRFQPDRFDADGWAAAAVAGGMKYAVLTSKHHDGYCLFDSAVSDYTATKTAPGRDLVAEYVEAFRRAGLRVGLYFSLADWSKPAYFSGPERDPNGFAAFIDYTHAQVCELCTNYGPLDVLWFDGAWPHDAQAWRSDELLATIRSLQPGVLVNNRAVLAGDFDTPEQRIAASAAGRPWEACLTATERWWGWHRGDTLWKSPREVVHLLCRTAGEGGNLLYNVGPKPDGAFPPEFVASIGAVGEWLGRNGEAVYGTRRGVSELSTLGCMTVKGNTAYLLVLFWPGSELHLSGIANRVRSARFLADGTAIDVLQVGEHIHLRGLPEAPPDPLATVIALDLEGEPMALEWARDRLWEGDAGRMRGWAEL